MEKAILKTLIYADIFDFPLKINEIHRWLVGKKATLRQAEKALRKLSQESRVKSQGVYYFLQKRKNLVAQRLRKEKQSAVYLKKAKIIAWVLKLIPWVKLVGISGGLALENTSKKDDIDLFIITAKNRLWLSRLFCLGLLAAAGQRRKVTDTKRQAAGKLCLNILLEEDKLEQKNKDIFVAHEVLQMRPLWQREGIYSKYLEDNSWVFKFLPNWITDQRFKIYDLRFKNIHKSFLVNHKSILDYFENLAKKFQLWHMKKPKGLERIEEGAVYFHPEDCRLKVLSEYKKKLSRLLTLATSY